MDIGLDVIRYVSAMLSVIVAGCCGVWLSAPRNRTFILPEFLGLTFLIGAGIVTLTWFILGLFAPSVTHLLVGAFFAGVAAICIVMRRHRGLSIEWPKTKKPAEMLLTIIVGMQIFTIIILTVHYTTLGWDGLFNWEFKARISCLSDGTLPPRGEAPAWSHPRYPPFIPLMENWLYSWLGRCDQSAAKYIFPAFYIAAVVLLYTGMVRLNAGGATKFIPPLLLFFVPLAVAGDGSASSGYADFPLAVVYLASVIYLVEYLRLGSSASVALLGAVGALLPWIKQEGIILLACIVVMLIIKSIRERRFSPPLIAGTPGALIFIGWEALSNKAGISSSSEFLPVTPDTLRLNFPRLLELIPWLLRELVHVTDWGLVWPAVIASAAYLMSIRGSTADRGLVVAVSLPIIAYLGLFVFSAWSPFMDHVASAFPRLMLQTVPVSLLLIGGALSSLVSSRGNRPFYTDEARRRG